MALPVTTTQPKASTRAPLHDLTRSFVRHLEAENRSPHTIASYRQSVLQFATFLKQARRPLDPALLRRQDVEAFIRHLLTTRSATTAAVRFRSLQAFCRWLLEEGEIAESPMLHMKPPTVEQEPPPILRESELQRLFKTFQGDTFESRRDRALLELFLRTGARRAEILNLRYLRRNPDDVELNDLDLDRHVMRVMGKGKRVRFVPLDPKCVRALDRYLRVRDRHSHADLPWLWLGHHGGRLTPSGAFQMIKRRGDVAGIRVHPHSFRHAFAHEWLAKGGEESDLMQIAGWNSPAMLRRYASATRQERALSAYQRTPLFENV